MSRARLFRFRCSRNDKPPGRAAGVVFSIQAVEEVLEKTFTLCLLACQFPGTANCFSFLARFLDRRFLEMLLKLHFTEHAFTLQLFLQGTECLIDVIVANAHLHVVFTTFLS